MHSMAKKHTALLDNLKTESQNAWEKFICFKCFQFSYKLPSPSYIFAWEQVLFYCSLQIVIEHLANEQSTLGFDWALN